MGIGCRPAEEKNKAQVKKMAGNLHTSRLKIEKPTVKHQSSRRKRRQAKKPKQELQVI